MSGKSTIEPLAARLLQGPLTAAVAALCALMFVTWLPGYLTWPWWCDHDHFATVALGWDAGRLPYRDILCNNFPGTIYLFWVLGKLFGWGQTWTFWALDAALLVGFGAALVLWSRRRLGGALPGLIGLAAAFGYAFNLDYSQAAQRDGQAPLLALTGLLVLLASRGRFVGRASAVALLSFALVIRPQVILLAPAYALALWLESDGSLRSRLVRLASWGAAVVACTLLWFAPLLRAGLGPDILDGFRTTVDGAVYSKASPARVAWELVRELLEPRYALALVGLGVAACHGRGSSRESLVMLTALAGALLYRPLSPLHHAYLAHPMALTWAASLAVLAALVLEADLPRASWRVAALLLVVTIGLPSWPRYSDPRHWRDFAAWSRGVESTRGPTGYARNPDVPAAADLDWGAYRDLLSHLDMLPPDTRVANLLAGHAALNGPSGRLPALPAESTVWLALLRPEAESHFADTLREAEDSVVVWEPDSTRNLERIRDVIESRYAPSARFGAVEVWSRKAAGSVGAVKRLARTGDR